MWLRKRVRMDLGKIQLKTFIIDMNFIHQWDIIVKFESHDRSYWFCIHVFMLIVVLREFFNTCNKDQFLNLNYTTVVINNNKLKLYTWMCVAKIIIFLLHEDFTYIYVKINLLSNVWWVSETLRIIFFFFLVFRFKKC